MIRLSAFALILLAASLSLFDLAGGVDTQPKTQRRIGVLLVGPSFESKEAQAFRQGLGDAGYTEGRDVAIEWRYASGDYAKVPELVTDLIQRNVEVIVVDSAAGARAAKQATSRIPIVMSAVGDPVGEGLVSSIAHPEGNVTGLSLMSRELTTKRLELLREVAPRAKRVAILWNPDVTFHAAAVQELKAAAPGMSIELKAVAAHGPADFGVAFSAVERERAQAMYVLENAAFSNHRAELLEFVNSAQIPAIYGVRSFVTAGGLMSYGANLSDLFRRSAKYVDKILKGAKPGDLPIEQPTKFELVVNLRTARVLGITIPASVLVQADEVIR